MLRKRMKGDDDQELEIESGSKKMQKKKDLTISEMDEWMNTDDDEDNSDQDSNSPSEKESNNKKEKKKKASKKRNVEDEAFEESDDGDGEGRELDYIDESSERLIIFIYFMFIQKCLRQDILKFISQLFNYVLFFSESDMDAKSKDLKSVAEEDGLRYSKTSLNFF